MTYHELEKALAKMGCYKTNKTQAGHPLWYSPITGKTFQTSHHGKKQVASGTLKKIKRDSGLE
ncbi:MAG: type II toxin-antitoxin system HicA family toxin [Bacteroidales bacterium]|nr:type II toxin-antitoxin system HicA family toxin [Bacteroidales bacterium]